MEFVLEPILPLDWISAILTNPVTERAFYLIITLALVMLIDRRLLQVVKEFAALRAELRGIAANMSGQMAHQTSRMAEIRNFMRDLLRKP